MKSKTFITNSYLETQKVGENLIGIIPVQGLSLTQKALVIALHGDLGSGKTTFVQGLARGLGIKRRIISPTFIIMRTYKIKFKIQNSKFKIVVQNSKFFYHIDLYRTENESDIEGLGIKEIINDSQNIVAIEWPEKMGNLLPKDRVDIYFENLGDNKRKITIDKSLRHCEERSDPTQ